MNAFKTIFFFLLIPGLTAFGQDIEVLANDPAQDEMVVNAPELKIQSLLPVTVSTPAAPVSRFYGLPSVDIYCALPLSGAGAGMGFGMFSKGLELERLSSKQRLELRFGGDFYFTQYAHKKLGTVPLVAPQSGEAKVSMSQTNFGLNAVARFILVSEPDKFSPYLDLFTGIRGFSADMNVRPTSYQPGYDESTYSNLSTFTGWNFGASFGLMYSITKNIKLNTGIMYTTSNRQGEIDNIKSARIAEGNVYTYKSATPRDFFVLKAGITFLVDKREVKEKRSCCCCDCDESEVHSSGLIWAFLYSAGNAASKANQIKLNPKISK